MGSTTTINCSSTGNIVSSGVVVGGGGVVAAVPPPSSGSSAHLVSYPCPRSPPKYPDMTGKHRELVKEELKSVENLQPASRSCKEVDSYVTANPDPLIPVNRKTRRSCRFWRWLWYIFCNPNLTLLSLFSIVFLLCGGKVLFEFVMVMLLLLWLLTTPYTKELYIMSTKGKKSCCSGCCKSCRGSCCWPSCCCSDWAVAASVKASCSKCCCALPTCKSCTNCCSCFKCTSCCSCF
ncbi:hypothetical protein MKW92_049982 [Papaver armeniacum]|nr:hypothetical protein MKW92_049982 [Papaver armeniacum]